ncbi:hypothetical protein MTO96_025758 [Rhipicephalus appendiculatus]
MDCGACGGGHEFHAAKKEAELAPVFVYPRPESLGGVQSPEPVNGNWKGARRTPRNEPNSQRRASAIAFPIRDPPVLRRGQRRCYQNLGGRIVSDPWSLDRAQSPREAFAPLLADPWIREPKVPETQGRANEACIRPVALLRLEGETAPFYGDTKLVKKNRCD